MASIPCAWAGSASNLTSNHFNNFLPARLGVGLERTANAPLPSDTLLARVLHSPAIACKIRFDLEAFVTQRGRPGLSKNMQGWIYTVRPGTTPCDDP